MPSDVGLAEGARLAHLLLIDITVFLLHYGRFHFRVYLFRGSRSIVQIVIVFHRALNNVWSLSSTSVSLTGLG